MTHIYKAGMVRLFSRNSSYFTNGTYKSEFLFPNLPSSLMILEPLPREKSIFTVYFSISESFYLYTKLLFKTFIYKNKIPKYLTLMKNLNIKMSENA